ncbi:MAG: hypothetical protein HC894_14200 [Microcoleus sp. SM1_3_4]|nr:hypothetical protein [Microcoleus sp. SM1_3_4]
MQKTAPFRIKKILRSLNFLILLFATSLSTVNCQLSTINSFLTFNFDRSSAKFKSPIYSPI